MAAGYSPYIVHVRDMQCAQGAGFSLPVSCGQTPAIDRMIYKYSVCEMECHAGCTAQVT